VGDLVLELLIGCFVSGVLLIVVGRVTDDGDRDRVAGVVGNALLQSGELQSPNSAKA
jgi:hypothetical protein